MIMKTKTFSTLAIIFAVGILLGSCSNYNSIQYRKSSRISTPVQKTEVTKVEKATVNTDLTEDNYEKIEEQTSIPNVIVNDDNNTAIVANSSIKSIEKLVKQQLTKTKNKIESKSVKNLKKRHISNSPNEDDDSVSDERQTFDIMHWFVLGLLLAGFATIALGFVSYFELFFLAGILILLATYILSILHIFFLAKRVPEKDKSKSFDNRLFFSQFVFISGTVLLALAILGLSLLLLFWFI